MKKFTDWLKFKEASMIGTGMNDDMIKAAEEGNLFLLVKAMYDHGYTENDLNYALSVSGNGTSSMDVQRYLEKLWNDRNFPVDLVGKEYYLDVARRFLPANMIDMLVKSSKK